jgi:KDO2-lipid IV(A) lauroyltransferase
MQLLLRLTFRLTARMPLWLLHAAGALLGWLVYWGSPTYRLRFRENAAAAGVTAAQSRGAIAAAGMLAAETPWLWLRPAAIKQSAMQWRNEQVIEQALAQGKGLLLMTPHIGSFEASAQGWAGHLAPRHGPMVVLYKPSRIAWLDTIMREARSVPGLQPATTTMAGVRVLFKTLRQGGVVGLLPDQVPPQGMGVWAPFFGKPAYTMTLAFRLARQTGAPIVMAWADRLPFGRGYSISLELLRLPLDGTDEQAALALNAQLERMIVSRPDLYLWGYARYKQPRQEL